MIKLAFITTLAIASTSFAGTASVAAGKGKSAPPASTPAASAVSGSFTAGYDSAYMIRGVNYGDNLASASLDLNIALSDKLTLNVNAWYGLLSESQLSVPNTEYNEFDLYSALLFNAGPVTFGPTAKWYNYHNGAELAAGLENQYEFGIVAMTKAGPIDLVGSVGYEIEADTIYAEIGASTTIAISDKISLVPGAVFGYGDYSNLGANNDANHAAVYVKLPIALSSSVTLTPYVAANFPLGAIDTVADAVPSASLEDEIYGGIALNVKF